LRTVWFISRNYSKAQRRWPGTGTPTSFGTAKLVVKDRLASRQVPERPQSLIEPNGPRAPDDQSDENSEEKFNGAYEIGAYVHSVESSFKTRKDKAMRKIMIAMLVMGGAAAFSPPSFAAQPQNQEPVCIPAVGCASATERSYDQCRNLAVERGASSSGGRGLNWFIYECLTGRIPR
jgi:hypothetical protein